MLPLFADTSAGLELITDGDKAIEFLRRLDKDDKISIDIETTALDFMRGNMHGVVLANQTVSSYISYGAERYILPYLQDFLASKKVLYGHNLPFDIHFLDKYNIKVEDSKWFDTMAGWWLRDENEFLSLKYVAEKLFGVKDPMTFKKLLQLTKKGMKLKRLEQVTIHMIPPHELSEYAAKDGRYTYDLGVYLEKELEDQGLMEIFKTYWMPFVLTVGRMEGRGIYIDQKQLAMTEKMLNGEINDCLAKMKELAPNTNPTSLQSLRDHFFVNLGLKPDKTTDTGLPKLDETEVKKLVKRDKTGFAKLLLTYRGLEKLRSTYVEPFKEVIFEGRIYGNFGIGPVTGRLKSDSPNLQNIPARTELGKQVRRAFSAPPGRKLIVADYSQMELRLLAHYCKDENQIAVFLSGGDPHTETATRLGIDRKFAKNVNFGVIYGMGARGLCDFIEKVTGERPSEEESQAWLDAYLVAYPGFKDWRRRVIKAVRRLGYVKTISGRYRRLHDINSPIRGLSARAERQSVNTIIQGSAGDIIARAMIILDERLREYDAFMVAQVHDELVVECPEHNAEKVRTLVQDVMTSMTEYFNVCVPLLVEAHIGDNWSDTKG